MPAIKWREFKTRADAGTFRDGVAWVNDPDIILKPVREHASKFYVVIKDMSGNAEDFAPPPWEDTLEKCRTARGMCEIISSAYHVLDYIDISGNFWMPPADREDSLAQFVALMVTSAYDQHPDTTDKLLSIAAVPAMCDHIVDVLGGGISDLADVISVLERVGGKG